MFLKLIEKFSLKWSLILLLLSLNFILMLTLYIFYTQTEKRLIKEIERNTAELTKAIQIGVAEVTGNNPYKLINYLNTLKTKGVKEISIISNTQQIIASTNPQKIGEKITHKKKELIIKAELGEPVSEEEDAYSVIVPITAQNIQYGYIYLKINKENFSEILKTNALKRMVVTFIIFLLGIIFIYVISIKYTKPIETLSEIAIRIAKGDLDCEVNINRKDEIGKIAESFNFMIQKLRENKMFQERLREAEHLITFGQLSKTIAHEIRNPLNFINLSIDYLLDKLKNENLNKDYLNLLQNMKQEIYRINNLITEYLEYTKPLKLNKKPVNILEIINDVISLIEISAQQKGVSIITNYNIDNNLVLNLDTDLIKSCLLNIITNALQAMENSLVKNLFIETQLENNNLLIKIKDTGEGVPEEIKEKIFEPFFSTKKGGLGIGLPLAKKIIEEHKGKIEFLSKLGQGSEVKIYLPLQL
ncbi:integral membrane sensor signal transduction histidine kinase [Thermodesulfobacterium geofontis OPF15]|jgi:signal transduction histidine kinase|uniref:histidine kinase n=1 Tax=Thermodesulfobacterium geofontis (strain OPF15) TaxID=795359 RepID=F8C4Y4_THEGP|nr:HAMP domain-containing sensor histidine kinase [Thermodesulfobacterium geofontis]AEH22768.1 integral membrane sensor signal transduction histidine kinase [Thermodesulfobacterium geofontis OPF15]